MMKFDGRLKVLTPNADICWVRTCTTWTDSDEADWMHLFSCSVGVQIPTMWNEKKCRESKCGKGGRVERDVKKTV